MSSHAPLTLHASAVAFGEMAILIRGASGSGKSSLALDLMAIGALLVADDRTIVQRDGDRLLLTAPDTIRGKIEARGVGILRADPVQNAILSVVVDLDTPETERIPPERVTQIAGLSVPLLHAVARRSFPAALRQYLVCGRIE